MALNEVRNWLVAYDIAQPRRLARVHRYLTQTGVPVQYSLFGLTATTRQMEVVRDELAALIDPGADDVRIYLLPRNPQIMSLGKRLLPEQALLLGAGDLWAPPTEPWADPLPIRRQTG